MPSSEISLLSYFFLDVACMSLSHSVHNKKNLTFISRFMPQNLHIQLDSRIAVCLKLSTVK